MSKTKEIRYESRKFLNKTGQGRSTVSFLYDGWSLGADWTIADCRQQAVIDFNIYLSGRKSNQTDFQAKLKKIDLITAQLYELRGAMVEAYAQYQNEDRDRIAAEKAGRKTTSLQSLLSEE